ncbi:very long chain fatty acid elongase AAEL008004-like [Lineus longissimus]|uniref:very long chain fatty acid elongase AAEL008004-like n=1 Tax=Lineus longissimus TaxID=88925 RepID=UPI002B4D1153
MAESEWRLVQAYNDLMAKADPRTADWPMMSSPFPSLFICLLYFYLVTKTGPKFMENREPYQFRKILVVFNIGMVGLSAYNLYEFLMSGWLAGYSLGCQPVDYSNSPQALRMASACWWFYISKFIELFDTLFFVLRKKSNLLTFLHVFHHGIMPFSWWFAVKFAPGGFTTFHATFNAFIHVMMYTYYGLAALGPAFQRFIWWKKYMTKMQMTQFVAVTVHSCQLFFIDCNFPKLIAVWILSYAVIFLFLFANFYVQAYRKAHKSKREDASIANGFTNNNQPHQNGIKKD